MRVRLILAVCLLLLAPLALIASDQDPASGNAADVSEPGMDEETMAVLYRPVQTSFSDLTPATRTIRVLVHYGRTEFFVSNGKPCGIEYEAFAEYEKFLNKKRSRHSPKIGINFIPVRFEDLIPFLLEGKGDIAAGLLTVTEERKQKVAFTAPYVKDVNEVFVSYSGASELKNLHDLSGKSVYVLKGSSFAHHLKLLNQEFAASDRPPVRIVEMPPSANVDDILEMVNAGMFDLTAADNFMADLWARVLPDIRVAHSVSLHKGGDIAWAVRPGNPEMLKSLNSFIEYGKQHLKHKIAVEWSRYFEDTKLIKNPLSQEVSGRVKTLSPHFKEAGSHHKLDWLLMMAQGYQESELNQTVRSPRGALGIMQLLPQTAKSIGYSDITTARKNIAAGVAYLNYIRQNYFHEPEIPPDARVDFALAAYNAGPARVQSFRQEAKRRGLNPNLWFHNVERIALDKTGQETVRYVANINKYYIAYRMSHHLDETRDSHPPPAVITHSAGPATQAQ